MARGGRKLLPESPRNDLAWRVSFVPRWFLGLFLFLIPKDTKNLLQSALFLFGSLDCLRTLISVAISGIFRCRRGICRIYWRLGRSPSKNVRQERTGSSGRTMAAMQFAKLFWLRACHINFFTGNRATWRGHLQRFRINDCGIDAFGFFK